MSEEIRELVLALHPVEFFARIDLWRRGGISAVSYESRVAGTRSPKLPAFDKTDTQLNEAEAEYREHLQGVSVALHSEPKDEREALRLLRKAQQLEELWLKPIVTPDKEMAKELGRLVSDAQSCNECGDTKEAWVKRQKKRGVRSPLWRRWAGDCHACYKKKERARLAEMERIDPEQVAS